MYFHIVLVFFVLFNSINLSLSDASYWDYGALGPDVWKDLFPTCGSTSQSPINIKTACTIYQSYSSFQFSSAYNSLQDFRLTNDGHTIVGVQINSSAFPLALSGGGLNETFIFNSFHLHWGQNYGQGSEHQINGQKYSGEIHFVHTNSAGTQNAVLGMFMQSNPSINSSEYQRKKRRAKVDNTNNATLVEWQKYFAVGDQLNQTNNTIVIGLTLATLMGISLDNFYRYSGSLTTPPCTENVIWTVFQVPLVFTEFELESFRLNLLPEDFRDPQPVYGRSVYRSFVNSTPSIIPDYRMCDVINDLGQTTTAPTNGNSILLMNRQLITYSYMFLFSYFFLI